MLPPRPLGGNPRPSQTHPDSLKKTQVPFHARTLSVPLPGAADQGGAPGRSLICTWPAGGCDQPGVAPTGAF